MTPIPTTALSLLQGIILGANIPQGGPGLFSYWSKGLTGLRAITETRPLNEHCQHGRVFKSVESTSRARDSWEYAIHGPGPGIKCFTCVNEMIADVYGFVS